MPLDRIRAHVTIEQDCWLWNGTVDKTTPILRVSEPKRKLVSARRYAYEVHNQVCVPSTQVVTNTCKNSLCVNPAHLTAQTRGRHGHRKVLGWKVEHCKRGHEFSVWNTGTQKSGKLCLACDRANRRANTAKHRAENPEHDKELRANRRKAKQDFVNSLKTSCHVCGESDPACLDFHHIDPETKIETVASLVYGQCSQESILEEIRKCVVLCSNCHRKLHSKEKEVCET